MNFLGFRINRVGTRYRAERRSEAVEARTLGRLKALVRALSAASRTGVIR